MRTAPTRFPGKTKAEAKMYAVDFSPELDTGVEIATATWKSIPDGLTFSETSILASNTKPQALISGGVIGVDYIVSLRVVTNESPAQTFEVTPSLKVLRGYEA